MPATTTQADLAASGPDAFRRALDRAVTLGWAGRTLAVIGGWTAASAVAVAAVAAVDLATGGRVGIGFLPASLRVAVVAAAAALATAAVRRRGGAAWRPSRLGVALETERRHPVLGERLSRAVEFLDRDPGAPAATGEGPGPDDTTRALEQLAVEQAAAAAHGVGGLAVPDLAADLRWLTAGLAMPVAVWLSTAVLPAAWGAAVLRQLPAVHHVPQPAAAAGQTAATSPPPAEPSAAADLDLPPAVAEAARRIRAAAALERRMADVLAELFARSPGVPVETLPRESRRTLDQLAAIQTEGLRTIFSDRDLLAAAAESVGNDPAHGPAATALARANARLADLDRLALPESPSQIAANRLGLAGGVVAATGDILAEAADSLGAAPVAPPTVAEITRQPQRAAAQLVRVTAALERIAASHRRSPDDENTPTGSAAAVPADTMAGTGSDGGAVATTIGDAGRAATTTATTDPRFGTGSASSSGSNGSETVATRPIERVWNLLPDRDRSTAGREAYDSMPAAYRPAIDAYYRLLLQSLPDASRADPTSSPPTNPR